MKKYITTDKHPFLKEGICLNKGQEFFGYELEKGWIKELQEPIWTDDDMIEFYEYARDHYDSDLSTLGFFETLEQFKKEKNK